MNIRHVFALCSLAVWGAVVFACSVDDDNPVVARRQIDGITNGNGEGGFTGDAANGAPICQNYAGGTQTAQTFALYALEAIKTDCRISATMTQSATVDHAIQCFQSFFAAAEQCPGFSLAAGTKDNDGNECTRPLGDTLSDEDLAAFEEDLGITLSAKGMSAADIAVINAALESQKVAIVTESIQEGKYTQCAANCKDAGAACVRDAGPAPPKDAGPPKDSGTTPPKDSGTADTGAPKDSGSPVDSGVKDAADQ